MALLNQQLETFIVTANSGSFRKAGEALYITPTAVQKQVSILEGHLGVKLFVRTHRGLQLTNAGKALYADGRYILSYAKEAEQRLQTLGETTNYEVRAVLSPISPLLCLPTLFEHVQRMDSSYIMTVIQRDDDSKTKNETLTSLGNVVDLVETSFDLDKCREVGINALKIKDIPIGIVLPRSHPCARQATIAPHDLQSSPLILPRRGLNQHADAVRNELVERGGFQVIEVEDYTLDTYNLCMRESCFLLALNPTPVHPLLTYRSVTWEHTIPYGLLYPASPSPMLIDFLRLSQQVLKQRSPYRDVVASLP